jgi:hypothetical protein
LGTLQPGIGQRVPMPICWHLQNFAPETHQRTGASTSDSQVFGRVVVKTARSLFEISIIQTYKVSCPTKGLLGDWFT